MTTLNAFGQRLTKALAAVSVLAFLVSCGNVSTPELAAGAQLDLKGNEVVSYKGQTYPALKQVATGLHAYTTTLSVSQGSVAKFHVSDQSGSALRTRNATADVFRLGLTEEWISSATVATKKQAIPANAWKACCNWPVSMQLNVGANWKGGLYRVDFSLGSSYSSVFFVVKNSNPGTTAKTVLQVPFHTSQAYNNWGDKSLYDFNSSGGVKADQVSLYRPNVAMEGEVTRWIHPFIKWAEKSNIALEYITSHDMETSGNTLSPYKLFVTVGHDEYWSTKMRNTYDSFVANGGNAAILSGNTMWWKVDNVTDSALRPGGLMLASKLAGSATGNWYESSPEGKSIGASFIRGAYVDETAKIAATKIGYKVIDSTHWVFAGTQLASGAVFGQTERIFRYEADGVDFTYDAQKIPRPTGGDGVSAATTILALVPLTGWEGNTATLRPAPSVKLSGVAGAWATMTIAKPNGWVFNAATTDWTRGLEPCIAGIRVTEICTITKNVIEKLSGAAVVPPPPPPPPPPPNVDPEIADIYRYSASNSLGGLRYLFSQDSALTGEWSRLGTAHYGLKVSRPGSMAVNRYSYVQADGKKRYIFSTNPTLGGGWTLESVAFYGYEWQTPGSIAVHEHYRTLSDGWHFTYDLSATPATGWTYSGPAYYVPAINTK